MNICDDKIYYYDIGYPSLLLLPYTLLQHNLINYNIKFSEQFRECTQDRHTFYSKTHINICMTINIVKETWGARYIDIQLYSQSVSFTRRKERERKDRRIKSRARM